MLGKFRKSVTNSGDAANAGHARAPISARDAFFQTVEQVAREDRLPFHLAMAEVRIRRPDLVASAFPSSRPVRHAERELLAA